VNHQVPAKTARPGTRALAERLFGLGRIERYAKLPFLKFLTCDDAREKPGFE
jgi:hypothetical protein